MNDDKKMLHNLMKDYWEFVLEHHPSFATYIGDHRYDGRLENLSEDEINFQADFFRDALSRLENVRKTVLTGDDVLNLNLFRTMLQNNIRMHELRVHYLIINQMHGPHLDFPQLVEFHPFDKEQDIDNYISRLNAYPVMIDQVIDLLEKGIKAGYVEYRRVVELALKQIETFKTMPADQHPMFSPIHKLESDTLIKQRESIEKAVRNSIESKVTPAYEKLFNYVSNHYISHCRDKEGIWALPDGQDMYEFYTRYHTTTDLSPVEIHEIGKVEVERIKREMQGIINQLGEHVTIREFTESLKKRNDLYPMSGKEIISGYRRILSDMDKKLPDYFGRLPRAKYDIKEIEQYRQESAPAAYYYPPPRDFSRPGYFYANTYKPETRPKFLMEALAYHEAVPGHHLQIAIMQEQGDLPDFRKHEGSTAFIEGWALYAEKLSGEMGFYRDILSEYGRLNFEIWRAVRLVVDTGMHYYKWSRDKAIDYCLENSAEDKHEVEVEIDRYIAMPGQALAYKIGEMKILEIREKTKKTLGEDFNIKNFHDRLLENGALPMSELERVMDDWISESRKDDNHKKI